MSEISPTARALRALDLLQGRPGITATELAQRVTDRCIQVLGGLGYTLESPIQSMWRHARVKRIGHGTTEINRWMIARSMLRAGT